jgi:DNA-binding response OmpR family regulator
MSTLKSQAEVVKVLVVDDEASAVDELVFTLSEAGFSAVGATSASQGLECFLKDEAIGVIISDIRMPLQDGIGLLKKVRRCGDRGLACEVILATGFPEVSNAIDAIELKVGKYLLKPVDPDEVLAAVAAAVSAYQRTIDSAVTHDLALSSLKRLLDAPPVHASEPGSVKEGADAYAPIDVERARLATLDSMLHFRNVRSEILPQEIFGDPAWFMLLELAVIERRGKQTSVSGLCMSAKTSQTTALRRVQDMVELGLIVRHNDPGDRRRTYITLSKGAREQLNLLLDRIGGITYGETSKSSVSPRHKPANGNFGQL